MAFSWVATILTWYHSINEKSPIFYTSHHVVIQTVVARFNKGRENANKFVKRTMQLLFENRVPSAHLRLALDLLFPQ